MVGEGRGCLSRRLSAPSPCGHRFALAVSASRRMPRLTLQPSGGAQRWPSPCLPISESPRLLRRVVGVVVVPGKPRSWPLCAAGGAVAAWWPVLRSIPGPPPPLAWLAAVSVGKASLPVSQRPHPLTQNSQAAAAAVPLLRSSTFEPAACAAAHLQLAPLCASLLLHSLQHKHTRPALLPSSRSSGWESRLEKEGSMLVQTAICFTKASTHSAILFC